MFSRTVGGLGSEHLFYDVDFVVYCEGTARTDNLASMDEVYWQKVFFLFDLKVQCKSRGSKPELLMLAQLVVKNGISNVIVAMDRDYDDLRSTKIDHPKILYTFGYSWESDLVLQFDFDAALSLFVNVRDPIELGREYQEFLYRQSKGLRRALCLDVRYFDHRHPLFDRNKPMSIVQRSSAEGPTLNRGRLVLRAKSMRGHKNASLKLRKFTKMDGFIHFFGKTVAHLIYHWFAFRSGKYKVHRKVAYLSFLNSLISTISFDNGSVVRNCYYRSMLARISGNN